MVRRRSAIPRNRRATSCTQPTAFVLDGDTNLVVAGVGGQNNDRVKKGSKGLRAGKAVAKPHAVSDYAVARMVRQDLPSIDLSDDGEYPESYVVAQSLDTVAGSCH